MLPKSWYLMGIIPSPNSIITPRIGPPNQYIQYLNRGSWGLFEIAETWEYQVVPGETSGAEVSKIGRGYRNSMAYRKAFGMQRGWSFEVVRCINEWANGCWDANEMTWRGRCTTEEWSKEAMNQWINEPVTEINESMKQQMEESVVQ